jgi:hypothetical protein
MPAREGAHHAVAGDLGDDGGAGDGMAAAIAADDGGVLHAERADPVAVHDDVIGRQLQPADGAAHGEHRGVVDVEAVDLAHARGADGHGEGALGDARRQLLALVGGELLGVVDAADGAGVGSHDHRTSDDGAREGAPSDFIHSGDEGSS